VNVKFGTMIRRSLMVRVNYEKLKGESLIFPKDARDG